MNFSRRLNPRSPDCRGFSLIEMLISMVIFTIVMGIIYSYLLTSKNEISRSETDLDIAKNAEMALRTLREDLYQIGYGRDVDNDQPRILRATPYDLVFCADLDRDIQDTSKRYGSYSNELGIPSSSTSDFTAIRPLVAFAHSAPYWGWDRAVEYGSRQLGAEIVRYSLDYNNDGIIDYQNDSEDAITGPDPELTHNQNKADFYLNKEWWGCIYDSESRGYRNAYAGVHPVAYNIRGNLYNPNYAYSDTERADYIYPNNEWPMVLFTYWGHFINTETPNDDPTDEEWDGEPLDLWGDWGGQMPPNSLDPHPVNIGNSVRGDGKLDSVELKFMFTHINGIFSRVTMLQIPSGGIGEIPTDPNTRDWNGNGILGENRLDQFIRRIGVTVIAEAGSPDPQNPNLKRSNMQNANNPQIYPFRDYEVSIEINPQNLVYSGSPQLRFTPSTSTPVPSTPTPVPPTATTVPGEPTSTPEDSPTPTPTVSGGDATPTPPSSAFDPEDDEIILGSTGSIVAVGLPRDGSRSDGSLCDVNFWEYPLANSTDIVIAMEGANLCDNPIISDKWNDLVYATNNNIGPNLHYMQHLSRRGIDGFEAKSSIRVPSVPMHRITAIAVGDVGHISGLGLPETPEIIVAYRSTLGGRSYITVVTLDQLCGNLIEATCPPFELSNIWGRSFIDLEVADTDGDGVGEILAITDSGLSTTPQVYVFNYRDAYNDRCEWDVVLEASGLFGLAERPAKVAAGYILSSPPNPPDVIVASEMGNLRIFRNRYPYTGFFSPYNPSHSGWQPTIFTSLRDLEVYIPTEPGNPVSSRIAVFGQGMRDCLLMNYGFMIDPTENNMTRFDQCSGPIYPTPNPVQTPGVPTATPTPATSIQIRPIDMEYFTIDRSGEMPVFALAITKNTVDRELVLITNPCQTTELLEECCIIPLDSTILRNQVNCITSTKNRQTEFPDTHKRQQQNGSQKSPIMKQPIQQEIIKK